jgi:hypothetical protein
MVDIDPAIPPPGPSNLYWLSTDTRVFQIKQNDSMAGVQQQTDPFGFITGLVGAFNALPNDNNHPFLTQLSQDENASQWELSPTMGGTPVFNYAVANIRSRGNVPAQNVSAFFRAFKTMVSALDYDQTRARRATISALATRQDRCRSWVFKATRSRPFRSLPTDASTPKRNR